MNEYLQPMPVTRKLLTPGVFVLLGLMFTGLCFGLYRYIFGLGSVTNLSNQYPWGIWIGIDVASGVALAAGGFTTSALVHIFYRKHYHTVIRPALLTAMLGYTFVGIGLLVDLGKYYNIWHPMLPSMWQGNSALFEVGMCVMAYLTVLYIEFLPIACERFIGNLNLPGPLKALTALIDGVLRLAYAMLGKVMWIFIIAGVVLSCMHQSSLGVLMLIAPFKMHALWYTPILPLLFLVSAVAVGFPMVIMESMWASKAFGRKPEIDVLSHLARFTSIVLGLYLALRMSDLAIRGNLGLMFEGTTRANMFLVENIFGVALPFFMLLSERIRRSPGLLFTVALLIVLGVVFNRINVFLTAYMPPYATKVYFPAIGEIAITFGLISALILSYRIIVTYLPVISHHTEAVT